MRSAIGMTAALAVASALFAQPASAGPAFAYSWLSTNKSFEQCIAAAGDLMSGLNYPHVQRTRFGVTGETEKETLFVNCEDTRHVSIMLLRTVRPKVGEIDALVALMQQRLEARGQ